MSAITKIHKRCRWLRAITIWSLIALSLSIAGCSPGDVTDGDPQRGRVLYWSGVRHDGEAVSVTAQGDTKASNENFACVRCHRPSGFGSSEGGQFVPPISQPVLFSANEAGREHRTRRFRDRFKESQGSGSDGRVRMPNMRPAYTDETLAKAIRDGVGSGGRKLSGTMPRYRLKDQDVADLIAFLKTLSVEKSPGVTEDKLHLATIVSDDVDPAKQKAVIDTLTLFTDWYNRDIGNKIARPGFSPYHRSEFHHAYRPWDLHVWRLTGPPSTWREQLAEYYAEQSVFAVVSGIVEGPWAPVDAFCNEEKLPCVFPNTELPNTRSLPTEEAGYGYSLYFSRGMALEGEVLATYLAQLDKPPRNIVQIRAGQPAGHVPAQAFAETTWVKMDGISVDTKTVDSDEALTEAIASAAVDDSLDALVIWPGDRLSVAIEALNRHAPDIDLITLPCTALTPAQQQLSETLYPRVRLIYPYEKSTAYHPRRHRVRAWMRTQRLRVTHPRLQLQTYYAMTLMQYGIDHLASDFYRDYLIEFIEREAEANLNPGTHPSLSLGPGQRFASKGAYIIALTPDAADGYEAVSNWILP